MATRITTGQSLKQYLADLIDEGIKSTLVNKALTEKEKQAKASSGGGHDVDSLFGDTDVAQDKSAGDDDGDTSSKTMDDEMGGDDDGGDDKEVDAKAVVDKLNAIRSGKSFKDSAVKGPMEEWINSLSKTERVALYAFLKGIAQIVTGEVPAQQADDPSKHPNDVKMDKTNEPHVVNKKPNVIKVPGGSVPGATDKPKKKPEEDTSSPVPITPKRR